MRMSYGPCVLSQDRLTDTHWGHCHDQSQIEGRLSKCRQQAQKNANYLSQVGCLDGKPGADYGAGEEDKECRGKERDEHAVFFYYTKTERGRGGREDTRECPGSSDKIRVRGNSGVAIRGRRVECLGSGVDQDILPSVNTTAIIILQFALPCEFGKFGSLTYPKGRQAVQ